MRGIFRWGLLAVLAATPALAQAPVPPAATPAPSTAAAVERQGDSLTEQALRRVLGVLMAQYGDLTGKVPASLNDADIAMRNAVQALDAGDDAAAAAATQKAIEALQKGGQSMSQQLSEQFGNDQGDEGGDGAGQMSSDQDGRGQDPRDGRGGGWDGGRSTDRRDPLGRPLRDDGTGQSPDDSGVHVPERMEQARSRAIQEELRRREAEKTRPQPELDYLDRLLQQF